jgi:predicted Zn-dependent protease
MTMRTRFLSLIALCGALSLAACATNPVTGAREFVLMTEAQEIALGQESDGQVRSQMGLYDDDELQRYVEEIGLQMAARSHRPDLPWSFAVVDSPAVNAFAIPGGYVYLTRGIMAFLGDEADLAGVLGHEIGHVTARHSVQAYTRASGAQLGLAVGSIFSPAARAAGGLAQSGLGVLFWY